MTLRYERQFRQASAAVLGGAVGGALVGGVGSRLAMRLLAVTSDDRVKGLETDDGFIVGELNIGDTLGLVLFATFVGLAGGLLYLAVRGALPQPRRLWFGLLTALTGGAVIIHRGGIDFTVLTPHWLTIVLFIAIPLAGGVAIATLVERFLRSSVLMERLPVWAAAIPLLILGPVGVVLLGVPIAAAVIISERASREPANASWRRTVVLTARVLLVLLGALAALDVARDAASII